MIRIRPTRAYLYGTIDDKCLETLVKLCLSSGSPSDFMSELAEELQLRRESLKASNLASEAAEGNYEQVRLELRAEDDDLPF